MNGGLPLLVTRPEPGNSATMARAAALGLDAYAMPLFAVQAVPWVAPSAREFDALLLTSAQAVRFAGANLARLAALPIYAVGTATADVARAAGLKVALVGDADGQSLLDAMTSSKIARILWLCGCERSDLDPRGAKLEPLACYAAVAVSPPAGWADRIAAPAVLLAHSRRAAQRIDDLVGADRAHLGLVAISPSVAAAAGEGWSELAAAAQPTDAAMLALAHALCHKGRK